MKELSIKISIGFVCFILGIATTYFVKKETQLATVTKKRIDPFDQMDQMIDNAFNNSFFGGIGTLGGLKDRFGNMGFSSVNNSAIKINRTEDSQYKYIEIYGENLNNEKINIDIKNGMISIKGEIKKSSSKDQSSVNFYSSFNQSFSVPNGVRENEAVFDSDKDKIIIKFPKESV